jgi:hypothetical protein
MMPRQTSFHTGPGPVGPSSLDRLPSMPLELTGRKPGDEFVFSSEQGITTGPPSMMRNDSLGYSKVPLEVSGFSKLERLPSMAH